MSCQGNPTLLFKRVDRDVKKLGSAVRRGDFKKLDPGVRRDDVKNEGRKKRGQCRFSVRAEQHYSDPFFLSTLTLPPPLFFHGHRFATFMMARAPRCAALIEKPDTRMQPFRVADDQDRSCDWRRGACAGSPYVNG